MKIRLLLTVLLFADIPTVHSRITDTSKSDLKQFIYKDSVVRLYLVCEAKYYYNTSRIIPDGSKITVEDSLKKKASGKLHIINGEIFELIGKESIRDTFSLGAITLIKFSSFSGKIIAGTLVGTGWIGMVTGGILMATPSDNDPYGFKATGGIALFLVSLPIKIIGKQLLKRKRLKPLKYKFRIIKTEGFELQRNQIHEI